MGNTKKAIFLDMKDNVATLIADAETGDVITLCDKKDEVCGTAVAKEPIPFAHKIALKEIVKDKPVVKGGVTIGLASADIAPGDYVHAHNLLSIEGLRGVAPKENGGVK